MPCTAMNAAESGPPKPALALLAMRAMPKSVALIQRRAFQRSHSQCAEPMWSGCMWVTITRSTGSPSRPVANTCSQAARVAALSMPQSTMLQPSLKAAVWRGTTGLGCPRKDANRMALASAGVKARESKPLGAAM